MLSAASTAALLAVAAAAAQSPLFAIRNVTWTGMLRLPEAQCHAVEAAVLGRPLLFVSEAAIQAPGGIDNKLAHIRLRRHIPATLEVTVEPRRSIARTSDGVALDREGRVLPSEHALAGLPVLHGFALEDGGRRLADRDLIATLLPLFDLPTLAPSRIELDGDGGIELELADTGTRVRMDRQDVQGQLLKLRVFEESLGGEPLPARIDLRFQDQVVVRETGGRDARRTR